MPEEQTNTNSHETEQRRYWNEDLRYKKWSFRISMVAFALVLVGLSINFYQSGKVAKSVAANVLHSTANQVVNLDRLFIERPDLRPYFYDCKRLDDKDEKFTQVQATAELMLDVFDVIADQSKSFAEYYDKPEAWDNWIRDMFATSPVLRARFQQSLDWYDDKMKQLYEEGQVKGAAAGCN